MAGGKDTGNKKSHDRFYLASLCRDFTEESINLIVKFMRDEKAKAADRLKAAEFLLERGWGKAPQEINITSSQDTNLNLKIEIHHFNALEGNATPLPAVAAEPVALAAPALNPAMISEAITNELAHTTPAGQS